MKNIPVKMALATLDAIPAAALPEQYSFRAYQRGDIDAWVSLYRAAEIFQTINAETFIKAFHEDEDALRERLFFLCDAQGKLLGTSAAWYDDLTHDPAWGRVHWVAIHPDAQGQGLSKPLLTETLRRLRQLGHQQAYLFTSSGRIPALSLYIKYGFRPEIRSEAERQAWREALLRLPAKYAAVLEKILNFSQDKAREK